MATVAGSKTTAVTWSSDGGTITSTGLYTAPVTPGTYYVTATSVADTTKSDTATVTVDSPGSLSYQDPPASGYDFRFIRNATLSTPTHLVLELVTSTRRDNSTGLAFTLSLGTTNAVSWAKVAESDSMMVQNGTVFNLGTGAVGLKTTTDDTLLKAVVAQKGLSNARPLNDGVLARIALDANPSAQPGAISLSTVKFQLLTSSGAITSVYPASVAFGQLSLI